MIAIGGIWVHLMHEFGVPKLFWADQYKHVKTTIIGPRIMLELVSDRLLDATSRCYMGYLGAFNARVWGAETTRQNNYYRSQNHVRTRFGPFA